MDTRNIISLIFSVLSLLEQVWLIIGVTMILIGTKKKVLSKTKDQNERRRIVRSFRFMTHFVGLYGISISILNICQNVGWTSLTGCEIGSLWILYLVSFYIYLHLVVIATCNPLLMFGNKTIYGYPVWCKICVCIAISISCLISDT